ncbi:MAG: uridine kinase [Eubacteriales bacterium]
MKKVLTIGIAGGSGSGKTTLTGILAHEFSEYTTVVNHDDYYRAHDELSFEERERLNYDEPAAFDNDLFVRQLAQLKAGRDVECPIYDYSVHNRSGETKLLPARPVLLVDGILIFTERRVCDMLDLRVFVDTDADIRFIRRLNRDVNERGRSMKSVIEQYMGTLKPMHEKYVEPAKREANIVVPEGGENRAAAEMLKSYIREFLGI